MTTAVVLLERIKDILEHPNQVGGPAGCTGLGPRNKCWKCMDMDPYEIGLCEPCYVYLVVDELEPA